MDRLSPDGSRIIVKKADAIFFRQALRFLNPWRDHLQGLATRTRSAGALLDQSDA